MQRFTLLETKNTIGEAEVNLWRTLCKVETEKNLTKAGFIQTGLASQSGRSKSEISYCP